MIFCSVTFVLLLIVESLLNLTGLSVESDRPPTVSSINFTYVFFDGRLIFSTCIPNETKN